MTETPGPVHRFSHQAMGTFFEVALAGEEESYAGQAAQAAFKEIDRLENIFSRFNLTSEICQMNRLRRGESRIIGLETYECLTIAERIRQETNGAFDINVRGQIHISDRKLAPRSEFSGTRPVTQNCSDSTRYPDLAPLPLYLVRSEDGFEARLEEPRDGVRISLDLDLGGIGKGYALDKALAVLAEWSITNALIHGGTSTAIAIGSPSPPSFGWAVGVGGGWPCPDAPREIQLSGRALSGSGTEVKGQHILDPGTGGPAKGHVAAWVSHPSAAVADALSTAFMVMSTEEVEDYCRRHPDVWSLVVRDYDNCKIFGIKPGDFIEL